VTYSELTTYLTNSLGDLNTILNFSASNYQDIIVDAILDQGLYANAETNYEAIVAAMPEINLRPFRIICKFYLWRYALGKAASKYNQSADGANLSRSQMADMCKTNLMIVQSEMAEFDRSSQAAIYQRHIDASPYQ